MKNLLFLNNSYNFNKTCSSRFMYEFLSKHFNVDLILEENNTFPYDEINKKDYFAIVSYYSMADFSKLTCKNLIYFPMYDGFVFCREKMKQLKNVKIVNFCKFLHKQSLAFGFSSFNLQYFPEFEYKENIQKDKLFYWQRRNTSFSQLLKCFPEKIEDINCSKTILHSVTDGGETFIKPTDEEINNYKIEITNWFENVSDLFNLLDTTKYYIAPRKQEGIGFSYMDAMARGCVIIAHNDRVMNEYIKDGYNGYLIDFDNPKPIKFKDYETVQRNSINEFKKGREKYLESLNELVDFINMEPKIKKVNFGYVVALGYFVFAKVLKVFKNKQ